jgi:RHS repeat-associated protein
LGRGKIFDRDESAGYTYTGQYSNTADFGWMYYKARWYDPVLGRFGQAVSFLKVRKEFKPGIDIPM